MSIVDIADGLTWVLLSLPSVVAGLGLVELRRRTEAMKDERRMKESLIDMETKCAEEGDRPLSNEERGNRMILAADEHEKKSIVAGLEREPTVRKYHENRAEDLRKRAAKLLDEKNPPLCPDAATRRDYR